MDLQNRRIAILLLLVAVLSVFGCAPKVSYTVPEGAIEQSVFVRASNFRFDPNQIMIRPGVLRLSVENVASVDHNLTIEDESGNRLLERELPSGETVSMEVVFSEPGDYQFFCDKPFHTTFGMSGKIVVKSVP